MKANAGKLIAKEKRKDMPVLELRGRDAARAINKVLMEKSGQSEQIGNLLAFAAGVPSSPISQYADAEVADNNGDYFESPAGLNHFSRICTSQPTLKSEDSEEGAKED